MRLPYAPREPPQSSSASTQETYQRIASRRQPRPLLPVDLTLLHSPVIADGYNAFLGAIRTGTGLPADILELAVCRVAVLNKTVWEWESHSKLALEAGVTRHVLDQVLEVQRRSDKKTRRWKGMEEAQKAVLDYVDGVTSCTEVDDETWKVLQKAFEDRGWREKELVELTVAIAGYNAVSRIVGPLNVGEKNGRPMTLPAKD